MLPEAFSSPEPDNKCCSAEKAKVLEKILSMLEVLLKPNITSHKSFTFKKKIKAKKQIKSSPLKR